MLILASLRISDVDICFIDEYNVSEQDYHRYTWIPKGKESYIYNQPRRASLHIIAAVTYKGVVDFIV